MTNEEIREKLDELIAGVSTSKEQRARACGTEAPAFIGMREGLMRVYAGMKEVLARKEDDYGRQLP